MATLEQAFGYRGDNMNLPVRSVAAALPFYEETLGFTVVSRSQNPQESAVLSRDQVRMQLVENGGDPTQDGCAFWVTGIDALFAEFRTRGLVKEMAAIGEETRDGARWRVFFVVAPDGLCYWFGERQVTSAQPR